MKSKTIEKILASKHRTWCESITDEAVRKVAQENTIITGGSIVSLLTDQEVADYDIYFRTPEAAYKVAQYYVAKLLETPPPAFKDSPDRKVEIYAKLEEAIPEGQEKQRIGGMVKGPQPPRVRIVVKSAGIAGEAKQEDYQYMEGLPSEQQAEASAAYVDCAVGAVGDGEWAEGQVTDDTEPGSGSEIGAYADTMGELDDVPASEADPKPQTKEEKEAAAKRGRYRVLFVTSNAITLSDKMQLIIRFQGEPDQIHENFDFRHACSYWTSWERKLVCPSDVLLCIMSKELRYMGSRYPICSVIRLRKFLARGYTVNAGQIVKMAWQISKLNLADPNVLEDQLVGVDSAYFAQVISCLKERMEKRAAAGEGTMEVDGTYLMTLIDKIF